MNKILGSTKELLGIPSDVTDFDSQLVMHINTALTTLSQSALGLRAYQTTLTDGAFEDFLPNDDDVHSLIQMYIYTKVRLMFDPPSSSFVLKAMQDQLTEYEWRLSVHKFDTC